MKKVAETKKPQDKDNLRTKVFRWLDFSIFGFLLGLLFLIIVFSARINIQSDSVDYYTILQRITQSDETPITRNLHFVDQRSPGYPLISTIPYYLISTTLDPFVFTEKVIEPNNKMLPPNLAKGESERRLFPSESLSIKDGIFKDFYIQKESSWFRWKTILSLLITSYVFLFVGISFTARTLALRKKKITGASLIMLTIFTSNIFMHNIITTPAYATLTAFGLSGIFCYFFVKSFIKKNSYAQFFTGLFLGFLVLTRLESVIIVGVLCIFLIFNKKWAFLKNLLLGGSISLAILLLYNFFQFGTPFHFGILKGDINQLGLDLNYIFANILNPKSGMVFWSFLTSLGLVGLFLGKKKYLMALGISSLILIGVLLVRVPIMYNCIGGGSVNIGGLLVTCPKTANDALMLVRSDINRYIIILVPFAVLGLQNLAIVLNKLYSSEKEF